MRRRSKCALPRPGMNHLKRIAVLTGAKRVYGDCYLVAAAGRRFLVDYKFVRSISRRSKSTCFSVATVPDMPRDEVVASALLQLKNNPKLFKTWRKRRGYIVKADGTTFNSTY
jgi:hypothetical protein